MNKEIIDYLAVRRNIYILLGNFFYLEATEDYLKKLQHFLPVFKELSFQFKNKNMETGVNKLRKFLQSKVDIGKLETEFASVFLIYDPTSGKRPITPHESVYLSLGGLSMQTERDEVLESYYKEGFKRSDKFKEPEDHIKAEFDFIVSLTDKALEYIKENDNIKFKINIEVQKSFIINHIDKWLYKLCNDISERGKSLYFKAIPMIVTGFIDIDNGFIDNCFDIF